MTNKNTSYTAASTIPAKVITNPEIVKAAMNHTIAPIHIQLNPTNKCPLNCSFCSCKDRAKGDVFDWKKLQLTINKFAACGTKAVTITGGGDPLAYPEISNLIDYTDSHAMKVGLVTNAILLKNLYHSFVHKLTWCRISVSDEQLLNKLKLDTLVKSDVDWSFSYVLSSKINTANLINVVKFANENKFTHVRIVDDILSDKSESGVNIARKILKNANVPDTRVIYQGRKQYTKGDKRCLISLLKPNIDASGKIFPCCGIQYAAEEPSLTFDEHFSMGTVEDIVPIWSQQKAFDGSICKRCYYSDYNNVLNMLWDYKNLLHKEFI